MLCTPLIGLIGWGEGMDDLEARFGLRSSGGGDGGRFVFRMLLKNSITLNVRAGSYSYVVRVGGYVVRAVEEMVEEEDE